MLEFASEIDQTHQTGAAPAHHDRRPPPMPKEVKATLPPAPR
eukprot:SAG22_NODE_17060_length_312_cov_0.943662_1_plen_41_part_01